MTTTTTTARALAPAATIRPATTADHPAVRGVLRRAYDRYRNVLSTDLFEAYVDDLIDLDGRADSCMLLVAEAGGTVVGTVSFYPDAAATGLGWPAGRAAIRALAVDPAHQGGGAARRLVEHCLDLAAAAGASELVLHTAQFMAEAVRLYTRLGFTRDRAHDVHAGDVTGIAGADDLVVIAYRRPLSPAIDTYALGRSERETQRLIAQHQIYAPITRALFASAGITRGMKVLDLGSGAGDVAITVADIVGPEGSVVGVDMNDAILDTARTRAWSAGFTNIELRHGDVRELDLDDDFDAVVGRWILMYLDDPSGLLRSLRRRLRPGGIVAFLESADLTAPVRAHPPAPIHDLVTRWTTPIPGMPGPSFDMGLSLRRTFTDAGLPAPQLRLEAPIGGGPHWPGYAFVAETLRSLLPFLEQIGAVSAEDADIDTLEDRLRAEIVASGGVQILPMVVGAWSRAA